MAKKTQTNSKEMAPVESIEIDKLVDPAQLKAGKLSAETGEEMLKMEMARFARGQMEQMMALGRINEFELYKFAGFTDNEDFLMNFVSRFIPVSQARMLVVGYQKIKDQDKLGSFDLKVLLEVTSSADVASLQLSTGEVHFKDGRPPEGLDQVIAEERARERAIHAEQNKKNVSKQKALKEQNDKLKAEVKALKKQNADDVESLSDVIRKIAEEKGVPQETLRELAKAQTDADRIATATSSIAGLLQMFTLSSIERSEVTAREVDRCIALTRARLEEIQRQWEPHLFDIQDSERDVTPDSEAEELSEEEDEALYSEEEHDATIGGPIDF